MKKVIIAHGWDGSPEEPMLKWTRQEMEKRGFEVIAPLMPHPENPTIEDWVGCLAESSGQIDEDTIFVGHSVGCQTVLRYLERLGENTKIRGVVLVAPWFILTLENLDEGESPEIAKPWMETPIDFEKVLSHTHNFIGIFSDNDPYVPLEQNKSLQEKNLKAKTIVLRGKGHFTESDEITELPEILEAIENI